MSLFTSRLADYYSRHGLVATARRTRVELKRALVSNRQIVFYYDFASRTSLQDPLPASLSVERKRSFHELNSQELHAVLEFWNPKLARQRMEERFKRGASLWLIKSSQQLAGYGWTLRGDTIADYYFPLGENDVQFFDFHVFPKFRGRAIDWFLMTYVLNSLAGSGGRAFAEAAEWNRASLSSLAMTPFRRLGSVRKITVFGLTTMSWNHVSSDVPKISMTKNRSLPGTTAPAQEPPRLR